MALIGRSAVPPVTPCQVFGHCPFSGVPSSQPPLTSTFRNPSSPQLKECCLNPTTLGIRPEPLTRHCSESRKWCVETGAIKRVRRGKRGTGGGGGQAPGSPGQDDLQGAAEKEDTSAAHPASHGWQEDLMDEWRHTLASEAGQRADWEDATGRGEGGGHQEEDDLADVDARTLHEAKQTVAELIRAGDGIEEEIRKLGKEGRLTRELLLVIKNRFKFAVDENEREVAQCMDLLSRRIKAEMEARKATPSLRLLNDLLHLKDESSASHEDWLSECARMMRDSFLPENDPFSFIVPAGFDPAEPSGPLGLSPLEDDGLLLRIDFIREVDELLLEAEENLLPVIQQMDISAESVAVRLQVEERLRVIAQVRELRELAVLLKI